MDYLEEKETGMTRLITATIIIVFTLGICIMMFISVPLYFSEKREAQTVSAYGYRLCGLVIHWDECMGLNTHDMEKLCEVKAGEIKKEKEVNLYIKNVDDVEKR